MDITSEASSGQAGGIGASSLADFALFNVLALYLAMGKGAKGAKGAGRNGLEVWVD